MHFKKLQQEKKRASRIERPLGFEVSAPSPIQVSENQTALETGERLAGEVFPPKLLSLRRRPNVGQPLRKTICASSTVPCPL